MINKIKNKFLKNDFTYTMVGEIQNLSRPDSGKNVSARELTVEELRDLSNIPEYDLTNSKAIDGVAKNSNRHCFGTFNDGVVSAYIFLATSLVAPNINSAGKGFSGIGMRLPKDVIYLYKGFSLPEYRGQRQVNIAIAGGADALVNPNGWMISTVDIENVPSIRMLENVGLKRQDLLKEYSIVGKSIYRIPNSVQLKSSKDKYGRSVELFTPA